MKFLVFTFLALLASSFADDDACTERAETCVDGLLNAVLSDSSEAEVCKELSTSVDCLKDVVEDCLGDEPEKEVVDGIQQLEKLLNEQCGGIQEESDSDKEKVEKCFEENEDYIHECINEGINKGIEMSVNGNINEDVLKCTMYGMMAGCFLERLGEKCGETAVSMAKEELSTVPVEIRDACEAAGSLETLDIHLLDKKK